MALSPTFSSIFNGSGGFVPRPTATPQPATGPLSGGGLFSGASTRRAARQERRADRREARQAGGGLFGGLFGGNQTTNPAPGDIADDLKEQEAQRQAAILEGRTNIENAFGRFDPAYYNQFVDDYTGYYFPQIDEQYGRARGKSRGILADRGIGQSSMAGHTFADLARQMLAQRTGIADQALGASNNLRANVERTRSDLYALNETAADPAAANVRATAEATALAAPPTVSPLGQVFAAALQPLMYGAQAYRNRAPTPYQSPFGVPSGSGSGRVIS